MQDSAHRCIRNVAPSECIPGGALSASSYISNLHFSSTPGSAPAITPALQTTRFVGGSTVTLAEDGNLPEPLFDTARGMCANVPQHIAYSVLTLDGGGIAEVRADVTVANVSVATTGSLVVQQAFSVTFRSLSSAVSTATHVFQSFTGKLSLLFSHRLSQVKFRRANTVALPLHSRKYILTRQLVSEIRA